MYVQVGTANISEDDCQCDGKERNREDACHHRAINDRDLRVIGATGAALRAYI